MSEIRDHVEYLAQTIGPRPAGTEEEQQAALYIADTLNKEAGVPAVIEDFNCNPDYDLPMAICSGIAVLVAIVAMIVPLMAIPALILTLIAALLFAAEAFDRPVLSRFFNKGVSQNVVAKYVPETAESAGSARRRKIILVSHYDSGKVRKDVSGPLFTLLPKLKWLALGGMVALPVIYLIRCLVSFGGVGLIVINVITGLAILFAAINLLLMVFARTGAYNDGANCNAAGVAVLMDVAARVAESRVSSFEPEIAAPHGEEGEDAWLGSEQPEFVETGAPVEAGVAGFLNRTQPGEVVMHGEQAAVEEGLVPEGAELVYEAADDDALAAEDESPAARLLAAKAAIAAMTGRPVSNTINIDLSDGTEEAAAASAEAAFNDALAESLEFGGFGMSEGAVSVYAAGEGPVSSEADLLGGGDILSGAVGAAAEAAAAAVESVEVAPVAAAGAAAVAGAASAAQAAKPMPDWFVKAQQKAKKPAADSAPIQRSRYADALDAALAASSSHFQQANDAVISETEQRLQQMRNSIMEVKAPGFERDEWGQIAGGPIAEEPVAVAQSAAAPAAQPEPVAQPAVDAPVAEPKAEKPAPEGGQTVAFTPVLIKQEDLAREAASVEDKPAPQEAPAANTGDMPVVQAAVPAKPSPRRRLAISLPSMMGEQDAAAEASSQPAQPEQPAAAPEAEVVAAPQRKQPTRRVAGSSRANSLRSALPSIGATGALGIVSVKEEEPVAADPSQTVAFSYADAQATGPFDAVDLSGFDPEEDQVVGDAAYDGDYYDEYDEQSDAGYDSDYEDDYEDDYADDFGYSAPTAPEYVEMPTSRAGRFMDKFRFGRKKKVEERQSSPQEWLNVDDEFDARSAGAARGGWESFRQEDEEEFEPRRGSRRKWNGGAFSRIKLGRLSKKGAEEEPAMPQEEQWVDEWEGQAEQWDDQPFDSYGSFDGYDLPLQDEVEQIMQFRNPKIDTEVWFVALGSELAANGGMKAFLAEHASDLKGAIIVEIDGMGAGDLSVIEKEGTYQPRETSSRMKRYAKKAAQALGMSVPSANMLWANSSAAYAMQRGHQVMHVAGMLDGKPAYFGQADDVLDNVDEETLAVNSDFVMELLRQI